jgi:acetoin utilization deacetylase AcuC-like enzyme
LLIFTSDIHRQHHSAELDGGQLIPSWECPERIDVTLAALVKNHQIRPPDVLDATILERVHSPEYLDFMATAWSQWIDSGRTAQTAMGFCWPSRLPSHEPPTSIDGALGYYSMGADCGITEGTWAAALASAAIAQSATTAVLHGEQAALGLCRPPGHHATSDQFGGYCYLNNAAIAAQELRHSGVPRVGILDIDYHHGNGTQQIFYERDDVAFCSIHADPTTEFPFFSGHAEERGDGSGAGFTTNCPLPPGTDFDSWSEALEHCADQLVAHKVETLVVSLGVDTFVEDPISSFKLTTPDFHKIGYRLADIGLPTVFILEGGYAVGAMGSNVAAVLDGFEHH